MAMLALSGLVFLAIHIVPATPLRRTVAGTIGEGAYLGLFSLVSLISHLAVGARLQRDRLRPAALDLSGLVALAQGRHPAVCGGALRRRTVLAQSDLAAERQAAGASRCRREGIFAITRHPLMWSFGLWGIAHLISQPNWRGFWFFGLFALTALGGALLQERRKAAAYGASWDRFAAKTSFVPLLADVAGPREAQPCRDRLVANRCCGAALGGRSCICISWLFGVAPLPGLA